MGATDPRTVPAIAQLRTTGYRSDFTVETSTIPPSLRCPGCRRHLLPRSVTIEAVGSFDRPSDAPDRTLVFALRCLRCGTAGALVGSVGATTAPQEAEVLAELDGRARSTATPAGPPVPGVGAGTPT